MTVEEIPITDRASWLEMRKTLLTASDIGAAAGKDPYKTPLRLYNEKLGLVPDVIETDIMRRGRHFEAAAIEYLKERYPDAVITQPKTFLADREFRLGATPDALLASPGTSGVVNVQIKTVARSTFEKWNGVPPLHYQLQTLCEGMLLDAESNKLCALVVESHNAGIEVYDIPRDATAERKIREVAKEFWRRVDDRNPPPLDYSKDGDLLAAMFPQSVPEPVLDLSGDNLLPELLIERTGLGDAIKTAEERIKAINSEVMSKLQDAEVATLPGWRISWKTESRREYIVPASTRRVLRIKRLTDNGEAL